MVFENKIIANARADDIVKETSNTSTSSAFSDPDEGNFLMLTKEEITFLQASFLRAAQTVDVGAELIKRLLNDKRSLFKALLESQCGAMEIEKFTVEDINTRFPRAKQVGEGVVKFFSKVMEVLPDSNASAKIREMSVELGILHYKMRVWFQAENWLCVKNSLLEVVVDIVDNKSSISRQLLGRCAGDNIADIRWTDKNAQRASWTKVIQYVIRNMKRGFLSEALRADKPLMENISPHSDQML